VITAKDKENTKLKNLILRMQLKEIKTLVPSEHRVSISNSDQKYSVGT
jgi:hypothetical protein